MDTADRIVELLEKHGGDAYFGEAVTEREHALQAAYFASQEGAPDTLVLAALLHDVGHLLHGLGEDIAARGIDGRHEAVGAAWLERCFGPEVARPAALHVAAKRYLCAAEPEYLAGLSPVSQRSLELQGGPMTPEETRAFETEPFFAEAVRVRRWDDRAKVPGLAVPPTTQYFPLLRACARENAPVENSGN